MKYAIDRKFENTKEHNVIFYDMGSTSVKTSFVQFSAYQVQESSKNKTIGAPKQTKAVVAVACVFHKPLDAMAGQSPMGGRAATP